MKQTDLAYLAGLIDGEGCIFITRSSKRRKFGTYFFSWGLSLGMIDPRPLKAFRAFGLEVKQNHSRRRKYVNFEKPIHYVVVHRSQALALLEKVEPYMRLKRRQIENIRKMEAISEQARNDRHVVGGKGKDFRVTKPKYTERMTKVWLHNKSINQ